MNVLSNVKVVYQVMEGWKEDISMCQHFHELPNAAQRYVKAIESILEIPINFIGTGPNRIHLIKRLDAEVVMDVVTKPPEFKVSEHTPYHFI